MIFELIEDWYKNTHSKFTAVGEGSEYSRYLQRHPVQAEFIKGKTKAELAQELHDWKVRSTEQAITMQAEVTLWKNHAACLKEENSTQTKAIFKLQAEICRLTIVNLEQFLRLELQNQPTKDDGK